ncbi:mechanosensitive ion channel domain-containing protein [Psychromonas sp. KJ10-10]|uniref:mechanosensitive ion channel domain-containing protein n=1 Tax=Psychromonas sp. KJ10-10 TaxID=3391823 RepID=UPI0039B3F8FD
MLANTLEWVNNNQGLIIEYVLNIVSAIAIILIGMLFARLIYKGLHSMLSKRDLDSTIVDFVSYMVKYVVVAFVLIATLSRIGVQTTSFVALIGAAGLAIGLALQGSLSNFASGVLIIVLRPFKAGEYIEAAEVAGSVESVQIFATTLVTFDNKFVVVPNSAILGGNIINYSRKPTRRIDLVIGVSYNANLQQTKAVFEKVLKNNAGVLDTPSTQVAVAELGDSSVNFVVRSWAKSADYWDVRFQLIEEIKDALDAEGIEIPFPQMDVHMDK